MATTKTVKAIISDQAFQYTHFQPPGGDWERVIKSYRRSWDDIPDDALLIASQIHIDTGVWFPKPGELRKLAKGIREKLERGEAVLTTFEQDAQRDHRAIMVEYDRVLKRLFTDQTIALEQVTGEGWIELWRPYRKLHDATGIEYPLIGISDLMIPEADPPGPLPPVVDIAGKSWIDFADNR